MSKGVTLTKVELKQLKCRSKFQCYLDNRQNIVDTTSDKGGSGSGIRPYELLETALARHEYSIGVSIKLQYLFRRII